MTECEPQGILRRDLGKALAVGPPLVRALITKPVPGTDAIAVAVANRHSVLTECHEIGSRMRYLFLAHAAIQSDRQAILGFIQNRLCHCGVRILTPHTIQSVGSSR